MGHVKALAIKIIVHLLAGWIIFSLIFNLPVGAALISSLIVAILIYVVGDLLILRKIGNVAATVVDAGTALAVVWIYFGTTMSSNNFFLESLVFALVIGVFEWFFHKWLLNNVIPDERSM